MQAFQMNSSFYFVLNILLQILDDGRVSDAQGRTVNFENTIIVMTTNAGSDNSSATVGFFANESTLSNDKTMKALSAFLRPEFINRIDEIITFRHLDKDDFVKIANIMLSKLKAHLSERSLDLIYDEEVLDLVAEKSYSEKYGARNMRRFIQTNVEDVLAEQIISDYNRKITHAVIGAKDGELSVTCM